MSLFGIEDLWSIAAYALCIATVVFGICYSVKKGMEPEDESDD